MEIEILNTDCLSYLIEGVLLLIEGVLLLIEGVLLLIEGVLLLKNIKWRLKY